MFVNLRTTNLTAIVKKRENTIDHEENGADGALFMAYKLISKRGS